MQEFSEFESLLSRSVQEKNLEFQRHGRLKHLIAASQLTPELLEKTLPFGGSYSPSEP